MSGAWRRRRRPGSAKQPLPLLRELDRIAGMLHDSVLQSFGTALLEAQLCERLAQKGRYDALEKELLILQVSLNDAIDSVRSIVTALRQLIAENDTP